MSTQTSGDIADSTITHCSSKVEKLPKESVSNLKLFLKTRATPPPLPTHCGVLMNVQ